MPCTNAPAAFTGSLCFGATGSWRSHQRTCVRCGTRHASASSRRAGTTPTGRWPHMRSPAARFLELEALPRRPVSCGLWPKQDRASSSSTRHVTVAVGTPASMHVASSRSQSPSRTHITSPAFGLESSGCSRTVLQDVPCVRWMSRRASSPPLVRTLRHGTGSRAGGCASTVRLSHRRHRCRSSSTTPDAPCSFTACWGPSWHEGTHRHAVPRRTS